MQTDKRFRIKITQLNIWPKANPNYFANSHLHANGKQYFPGVEKSDDHPETQAVRRHTEQCWLWIGVTRSRPRKSHLWHKRTLSISKCLHVFHLSFCKWPFMPTSSVECSMDLPLSIWAFCVGKLSPTTFTYHTCSCFFLSLNPLAQTHIIFKLTCIP